MKTCRGVVWLCLFLNAMVMARTVYAEKPLVRPGVISETTDYWAPNTDTDGPPAGQFAKGDEVEVTLEFTSDNQTFRFVQLKGKPQEKSGWVKFDQVVIQSDVGVHSLPASSLKVNDMGFQCLRKAAESGKNSLISPYGIWANLQILRQGAKRHSLEEIENLIGGPESGLIKSFRSDEFRTVDCFIKKTDIELTGAFSRYAESNGLEIKSAEFDEATRTEINKWVFTQSNELIPEFFSPDAWNTELQVLLANVAYFRGEWVTKFNPKKSAEQVFRPASDAPATKVTMMVAEQKCFWFTNDGLTCDGVVLPYLGGEIGAVILVPKEVDGLKKMLSEISGESFAATFTGLPESLSALPVEKVSIRLPKVDLASEFNVDEALSLNILTSDGADLSGMVASKRVKLSRILQKTRLRMDETGTEAAAATSTGAVPSKIELNPPKKLHADHPYLVCITHWPTRTILFSCAIFSPNPAKNLKKAN